MAQIMVNFRTDEDLKKGMEQACKETGLSMTTAFTMYATKVSREKRIPLSAVPSALHAGCALQSQHPPVSAFRQTLSTHLGYARLL